jgi:hydroxyquinol 1,2-dioxygenase
MTSLIRHLHGFVRDVDLTGTSPSIFSVNHRMSEGATQTTVLGPFYVENSLKFPLGADISRGLKGQKLHVEGTVSASARGRLPGAGIDVW